MSDTKISPTATDSPHVMLCNEECVVDINFMDLDKEEFDACLCSAHETHSTCGVHAVRLSRKLAALSPGGLGDLL